jgi:hypothetical protein
MDNLAASLPPPAPLRRALSFRFQWGEQKFEMVASAAAVRTVPWGEAGEAVTWLHCKAVQLQAMKPGVEVGLTSYLIPAGYVTHAAPGPTFRTARAKAGGDLGIFPPTQPPPQDAVPLAELSRVVAALLDASVN